MHGTEISPFLMDENMAKKAVTDPSSMTKGTYMVTPEAAAVLLDNNKKNRNLKQGHIDQLVRDIQSGRWIYNGQAVMIDNGGNLANGQHRMSAVFKSGIPVKTEMIFNLSPQAVTTMDQGAKRTFADELTMNGVRHANSVATVCVHVWLADSNNGRISRTKKLPTNQEKAAVLQENPTIVDSVDFCIQPSASKLLASSGLTATACAYIHFEALRQGHDPQKVNDFFTTLFSGIPADGVEWGVESPIYCLRERVSNNAKSQKKLGTAVMNALAIKAFNFYVSGRTVKTLAWKDDSPYPVVNPVK